jgi:TP901 family phage tail tape measure protein
VALNAIGLGMLFTAKDLATGVMAKVRTGFMQTRDELGRFQLASASAFQQFGTGMKLFGAGAAGLMTLSAATAAAAKFGTAVAKVGTIADEAEFPLQRIEEIGFMMGRTYGGELEQQLAALYSAVGSGASTAAEAVSVMHATNQLAIGGLASVDTSMQALMGTLNAYGMDIRRAEEVSDSFFAAVKIGGSDLVVGTLGDALGRVAPTAAALGVQLDELTGSIARMTQVGIKTSEAVTGFKAILDHVIKPSSDAVAEAGRLGFKLNMHAIKAAGGFEQFVRAIVANPKFNKDTLRKLFGASTEALNAMIALSTEGGSKFASVMGEMGDKTGSARAAFERMSQTTEQLEKVRAAGLQEALVKIGKVVEPLEQAVLRFQIRVVTAFNEMDPQLRDFIVRAVGVASAVAAVVGGVMAARAAFTIAAAAVRTVGISVGGGLGAALGPTLLAVGALAAAAYGLKVAWDENTGGFRDAVEGAFAGVRLAFQALVQLFTQGGFSGAVREAFQAGDNQGIFGFAIRVYLAVERIRAFLNSMLDSFYEVVDQSESTFSGLTDAFAGVGRVVAEVWGTLTSGEAGKIFESFESAGRAAGTAIGTVFRAVVNIVTVVVNVVEGLLKGALSSLVSLGKEVFDVLGEVFSAIGEIAGELGFLDNAVDGSQGPWVELGEVVGNVVGFAANLIKSLLRTVGGAVTAVLHTLGGLVDIFTGDFQKGLSRVLYGIISLISGLVLGAVELLATVGDAILGTSMADSLKEFRREMDDSLRQGTNVGGGRPAQATGEMGAPMSSEAPVGASPAVASIEPQASSVDPAAVAQAAAAGAASAMSSRPMQVSAAPVMLDGERVGEILFRSQQSSAAASYQSLPLASE